MKKETLRISAMCTKKSYEVPKNVILLDGYAYASDGQGLLRCKDKLWLAGRHLCGTI